MDYVTRHPEYVRFFQTLFMNSPLAPTVSKHCLSYVDWRPPRPGILTMTDLPRLPATDHLLARKFDPKTDSQVLNELDLLAKRP